MVKSRPAVSEQLPEGSSLSASETEEPSSDLIPRSVSFTTWVHLPPARVVPVDSSARKWVTDRDPPLRPFYPAPPSGDDFFRDSLVSKVVHREEALLFNSFPDNPSHLLGPSLIRSRVRRQEFPWSAILFSTRSLLYWLLGRVGGSRFCERSTVCRHLRKVGIVDAIRLSPRLGVFRKVDDLEYLVQRWSHTTHTFCTSWGEFSPTLEDVCILLKLPMFGDHDVSSISLGSHLMDMAKDLKAATIDSAKYSREFLARRGAAPIPPTNSSTKTPSKKVRGTGNVLPPEQRKSPRESLKYTFATWVRYFYGDYDAGKNFHPGPMIPQPLKRVAFIAFWPSKYIFLGPPWESVSSSVFILACLLAEGTCLPLASLYLGSLYGRLDQIQDQIVSVRTIPEPAPEGVSRPLEPQVWGWTMGRPRQMLSELLDEEDQFIHRPYTKNLFPGVEQLHDLYKQDAFSSAIRVLLVLKACLIYGNSSCVLRYVVWRIWPYAYRPDCACRQFGLDQAPCDINLAFKDCGEAMKAVLFPSPNALPPFDPDKFIPCSRVGRVLDVWVAYHARLRSSVKRYEGQDSLQVFPNIPIMYKDPYYVTTSCQNREKSVSEGVQSKKRKASLATRSKGKFNKPKVVDPPIKKACRKQKSPTPDTSSMPTPPKKGTQTRSPKSSPPSPSARAMTQGSSAERDTQGRRLIPLGRINSTPSPDGVSSLKVSSPEKAVLVNSPILEKAAVVIPSISEKAAVVTSSIPEKAIIRTSSASEKAAAVTSPTIVPFTEAALGVPVPTPPYPAQSLSVEIVPILASLLPENEAHMLSEFSRSHSGFLLSEDVYPRAFLKPAYALFVDFLHFIRSHSVVELLSTHKSKVVEDMKTLSLFGFQGQWFDGLKHSFDRPVPPAALEDLDKINTSILSLEVRNNELKAEINRLQVALDQGEAKLKQLKIKQKDVVDARSCFDVSLDLGCL
ncbi:Aminotransferase-like, plant mobile domain [Sesbania bispinosa]|nr:Aminotransferase-like, plant mobile domain [Sesbania bispinosa]